MYQNTTQIIAQKKVLECRRSFWGSERSLLNSNRKKALGHNNNNNKKKRWEGEAAGRAEKHTWS